MSWYDPKFPGRSRAYNLGYHDYYLGLALEINNPYAPGLELNNPYAPGLEINNPYAPGNDFDSFHDWKDGYIFAQAEDLENLFKGGCCDD